MAKATKAAKPARGEVRHPFVVIFGDEEFRKSAALSDALRDLIPADADRDLILSEYDGQKSPDSGGPSAAAVFDDLNTLPFLADRRIVLIRDADAFISASRESLDRYCTAPSPTGTLILLCRSFPKTTRIAKAIDKLDCPIIECKKMRSNELVPFVIEQARERGKQINNQLAMRLIDLIGPDAGMLQNEIEKLAMYCNKRATITDEDIDLLVGQSREERIFAVMDMAATGKTSRAMAMWHQVLDCDPAAVFKVLGGLAFCVRKWMSAHQMVAAGESVFSIAPKVQMWNRHQELEQILRRMPPLRVKRLIATLAELDAQAKVGARSIENGVEAVLLDICGAAYWRS